MWNGAVCGSVVLCVALLVGLCEALCVAWSLCPQHPLFLCLLERNHNLCLPGRRPNIVVFLAFRVDLASYADTTQNLITSQAGLDGGLRRIVFISGTPDVS